MIAPLFINDVVLVKARPRPYAAVVEWIDHYPNGLPTKVKVRPLADAGLGGRARNVRAKQIVEMLYRSGAADASLVKVEPVGGVK